MAWRTRPLQLVLSGGPVTPTPTIEYNENTSIQGPAGFSIKSRNEPSGPPVMTKLVSWRFSGFSEYILWNMHIALLCFIMPPPLGTGGIMFSGCPSLRPCVRPKPEIPSFDLYMGPSGEVSGHYPENAWREWPEILHADVSWPSTEMISLCPRSVNFSNFGTILT